MAKTEIILGENGGGNKTYSSEYMSSVTWTKNQALQIPTNKRACGIVFTPVSGSSVTDWFWSADNGEEWSTVYRQNGTAPTFRIKFKNNEIVTDTYWSASANIAIMAVLIYIE